MTRIYSVERRSREARIPPLREGDHLTQKEFHRRYEAMHPDVRAELIGGIVYMGSPLLWSPHGIYDNSLGSLAYHYAAYTKGVQRANGPTAILGEYSEPQPDVAMRIEEASGGQSIIDATGYLVGAAELFMEASDSSLPLDLGAKKEDYREAGVIEYLVADLRGRRFHWFDLRAGETLEPDKKGIYRSRVFPGFWIDSRAFFTRCWTRA